MKMDDERLANGEKCTAKDDLVALVRGWSAGGARNKASDHRRLFLPSTAAGLAIKVAHSWALMERVHAMCNDTPVLESPNRRSQMIARFHFRPPPAIASVAGAAAPTRLLTTAQKWAFAAPTLLVSPRKEARMNQPSRRRRRSARAKLSAFKNLVARSERCPPARASPSCRSLAPTKEC